MLVQQLFDKLLLDTFRGDTNSYFYPQLSFIMVSWCV